MSDGPVATQSVKALLFDVFGTVVDWRTSLIEDLTAWASVRGVKADWTALVDAWRGAYVPSMEEVRKHPERGFRKLDLLHRQSLDRLIERFGIVGLSERDRVTITTAWHRLRPWPDAVAGLTRLRKGYIIGTLSNGNVALLTNMAKHAGLPWDVILSAELFGHYKRDPQVYQGAAHLLDLEPRQIMMVAAHNDDLAAARKQGMLTAFVPRPTEYGPHQSKDFEAEQAWTLVVRDFNELADRMGQ